MEARLTRELRLMQGLGSVLLCYAAVTLVAGRVALVDYLGLLAAYLRVAAGLWIFTACIAIAWLTWRDRQAAGADRRPMQALVAEALRRRWRQDRCLSLYGPPLLFAVLMATFNTFKQRVLPQAGFGMDAPLAALDRALFLGIDPARLTHGVFSSPWATWVIDLSYHAWFAPMALGVMACAFLPAAVDRLRYRYLISYTLLWLIGGSLLALALPAAGPCFQPGAIGGVAGFEPLMQRLAAQHDWLVAHGIESGLSALQYQRTLLAVHGGDALVIGGGISAMPSMHNALAVLFAITAFRLNRAAGLALAAYAALIWLGSIHLGWHYATDGPVAALVVVAVWRLSAPLADRLLGFPASPVQAAARAAAGPDPAFKTR